jgi:hypothetical protein
MVDIDLHTEICSMTLLFMYLSICVSVEGFRRLREDAALL